MTTVLRAGKALRDVEEVIERADGMRVAALVDIEPLLDHAGRVEGAISCLQDITDRKASEGRLDESEAFLRAVFAATPECIKIVARDGGLQQMNPAGSRMIEAPSAAAVQGAYTPDLIAPEDREVWVANHTRVCDGESLTWEFDIVALAGTRRHMQTHAVPLRGPRGRCASWPSRATSPKARLTSRRCASERRSRDLLEALPTAVYTTDIDGRITFFNQAAVDLLGLSA